MGNKIKTTQELNFRKHQSEYISNTKSLGPDFQFPEVSLDKSNQIQKLMVNCSIHNHQCLNVCVYKNCKSSLGVCDAQGCSNLHVHQGKNFLVSLQELNRRYIERVALYQTYCQSRQKYMNQIYDQVLDNLSNVIKFVKKDAEDMDQLFQYCNSYQDDNFKLLNGRILQVERSQLTRFLNTQPRKICQNKFQLFNNKLLKRKHQFTQNLSELQSETNKYKSEHQEKTLYQTQKISRIKTTIEIQQVKWEEVFQKVDKLKEAPVHLVLVSDGILLIYLRCIYL